MKLNRRLLLARGTGAMAAALCASHAVAGKSSTASKSDEGREMLNELHAAGPRIIAGEDPRARSFDRFAGAWDVDYCDIKDDGTREKSRGQLLAGWVLDGRALQDLWIVFPKPGEDRFIGTTLRFFDPDRKTWRVTWVSAIANAVTLLEGGDEGGRIVLRGDSPRGRLRWTFSDMTEKDFAWRGELSTDGEATWRLREDHRMYRPPTHKA